MEPSKILQSFMEIKDRQPFPFEAVREAAAQKDAVTPLLLDALDYTYENAEKLAQEDSPYALHLYAAFLLSQFREKSAFPKLVRLLTLDDDSVEFLFGDAVTEDYPGFLISTYDGNLRALYDLTENENLDPFTRGVGLDVCQWLFQNGRLPRADFTAFLRLLAGKYAADKDGIIGALVASAAVDCHLTELLHDIRKLYDERRADPMSLGEFDSVLDSLFTYGQDLFDDRHPIEDAAAAFSQWPCFRQEKPSASRSGLRQLKRARKREEQREESGKIGRNDPCPCGSGKKYKNCCLGKEWSQEETDAIRRRILLKDYPLLTGVPEGRARFTDFFDARAIEVDRPVYMALHHRVSLDRELRDDAKDRREKIGFLAGGYRNFQKLCEKENLRSFEEYDKRHRVHYASADWLGRFANMLEKFQEDFPGDESYDSLREDIGKTLDEMK